MLCGREEGKVAGEGQDMPPSVICVFTSVLAMNFHVPSQVSDSQFLAAMKSTGFT